jgi:sulfur relay (sulfurtransferase) DsrF/TusC family protein
MYFRQFLGRIVRRIPDLKCLQVAYCYLPADPGLAQLAAEIENEIRHCIHKKHSRLEDFLNSDGVERGDRERHPPAWESLGAVNEGLDAVIVHGNQLSLFQVHANTDNVVQVVHEKVSERLDERRSRSEEKALLVNDLRRLVGQYHKKTGKTHAQIHTQLNSAQGVRSQQVCTESQLRQRLQFIRRFLSES